MGRDSSPYPHLSGPKIQALRNLGQGRQPEGPGQELLEGIVPFLVQASHRCGQAMASSEPQAQATIITNKTNNCNWLSLCPSGGQVLLSLTAWGKGVVV